MFNFLQTPQDMSLWPMLKDLGGWGVVVWVVWKLISKWDRHFTTVVENLSTVTNGLNTLASNLKLQTQMLEQLLGAVRRTNRRIARVETDIQQFRKDR